MLIMSKELKQAEQKIYNCKDKLKEHERALYEARRDKNQINKIPEIQRKIYQTQQELKNAIDYYKEYRKLSKERRTEYVGTSRVPKEMIKYQQKKYAKDIVQPRDQDGNINPEFVKHWGTKGLTIDSDDVKHIFKGNHPDKKQILNKIDEARSQREN